MTSAEPGDGKTTVASCLATTASLAGQTVLLIDGDLRRSSLTATVGSGDTAGLIEILLGEAEAAEAIHPITALTDSPQAGAVSFMASGRKSPRFFGAVDWSKARNSVQVNFASEYLLPAPALGPTKIARVGHKNPSDGRHTGQSACVLPNRWSSTRSGRRRRAAATMKADILLAD